jgi:SAM-dependent methyltransferase
MDVLRYNREAWDRRVDEGDRWTQPVSREVIARARAGHWSLLLTPTKAVPRQWYPKLAGARVLGLASAGGQQCPVLAAAGAQVTSFDASPKQLARDIEVADREGLTIDTFQGDMRDLSAFDDEIFDLIFHPVSNCFVPEVRPVWRECARVLKPGGFLLAGFANPIIYTFDPDLTVQGVLTCKYRLPYSDVTSLTDQERRRYTDAGEPLNFGHTLEDQIGGQLDAGFVLAGMYEDRCGGGSTEYEAYDLYFSSFIATRAVKLR